MTRRAVIFTYLYSIKIYIYILSPPLDDNTGPVLCQELGLNLQDLEPFKRIQTRLTFAYDCQVIGSLIPNFQWNKDQVVS